MQCLQRFYSKEGPLRKERICSEESIFFCLRVNAIEKGGKHKNGRVASPEKIDICFEDAAFIIMNLIFFCSCYYTRVPRTPQKSSGCGG